MSTEKQTVKPASAVTIEQFLGATVQLIQTPSDDPRIPSALQVSRPSSEPRQPVVGVLCGEGSGGLVTVGFADSDKLATFLVSGH